MSDHSEAFVAFDTSKLRNAVEGARLSLFLRLTDFLLLGIPYATGSHPGSSRGQAFAGTCAVASLQARQGGRRCKCPCLGRDIEGHAGD
jgi:hypothetical protein